MRCWMAGVMAGLAALVLLLGSGQFQGRVLQPLPFYVVIWEDVSWGSLKVGRSQLVELWDTRGGHVSCPRDPKGNTCLWGLGPPPGAGVTSKKEGHPSRSCQDSWSCSMKSSSETKYCFVIFLFLWNVNELDWSFASRTETSHPSSWLSQYCFEDLEASPILLCRKQSLYCLLFTLTISRPSGQIPACTSFFFPRPFGSAPWHEMPTSWWWIDAHCWHRRPLFSTQPFAERNSFSCAPYAVLSHVEQRCVHISIRWVLFDLCPA